MKYQKKPIPVDVVQFRKDARWPASVFKHPWNVGPGDNDEDLPTVSAGTFANRYKTWISDGDWIVTYGSKGGLVETCRDSVFRDLFEPVAGEEDAPKADRGVLEKFLIHIEKEPGKAWCSIALGHHSIPYTTEANLPHLINDTVKLVREGTSSSSIAPICKKCAERRHENLLKDKTVHGV